MPINNIINKPYKKQIINSQLSLNNKRPNRKELQTNK